MNKKNLGFVPWLTQMAYDVCHSPSELVFPVSKIFVSLLHVLVVGGLADHAGTNNRHPEISTVTGSSGGVSGA